MKKSVKRVLSGMIACSILSSAFTAMAANSVTVTGISVLENNEVVETFAPTAENIRLTPEQMLEVTVKVTGDDEQSPVYASFLSNEEGKALNNDTVQYVGQKTIGTDGTAEFKFRPRATIGEGLFTAKSGATGALATASFNYTVKEADKAMTVSAKKNSLTANSMDDAKFAITGFSGEDYSGFKVYLDDGAAALASNKYTINMEAEELILTIKRENFADKTAGNKVKVVVKHDGYTDASGEISITAAVYNVTLNKDGGELAEGGADVTSYTQGVPITLPTLTKTHYTFDGWYESAEFTGEKVTVITAGTEGDKAYFAKFTPDTFAVNFEADGGTISGEKPTGYTYGVGLSTLPTPTREHYTFDGWYDTEQNKVTEITATDFGAKTFYAKWTADTYTVTLVANGAVIADGKNIESYVYGTTVALPVSADMTYAGHYFMGWYKDAAFTEPAITQITSADVPETGSSMTFYAKWNENEPDEYTVTFKNEDGQVLQSGNVAKDTMPEYKGETPQKAQDEKYTYTFAGWYPELAIVTGPATYTATYTQTARTYSVTLNANEGNIADGENVTDYTYGTAVTLPVPTRTGYTFGGWYEDKACADIKVTEISAAATDDKTYYAKWTAITYTITLNKNGGAFDQTPVSSYTYEQKITLPRPTKERYTFGGWYENDDFTGDEITEISEGTTGDKIFYAKWVKNDETVNIEVLDKFKEKVTVKKLVDESGNTTITVSAKENQTIPPLKLYRAIYTDAKALKEVTEITANAMNGNKVFNFAPAQLGNGETFKVMLWDDNMAPIINAITNN